MAHRSIDLGEPLPLPYRPKKEPVGVYIESEIAVPEESRRPIRLGGIRSRYVRNPVEPEPELLAESELEPETLTETVLRQTEIDRTLAAVDMVEENVRYVRELVQLGHPVSIGRLMEILEILSNIMDTLSDQKSTWYWDLKVTRRHLINIAWYFAYVVVVVLVYFAIVALYMEYNYRMD